MNYHRQDVLWSRELFVGLLVRSFVKLVVISQKVQVRLSRNFTITFRAIKVKVQGQNLRTENLQFVLDQPWCRMSLPNSSVRQKSNFDMKFDFRKLQDGGLAIGVKEGGRGHVPPKILEQNIFPTIITKNSGIFGQKNHVKFGNFVIFFIHIFRAKTSCPLTLTELLRLWA